jgi:hypothetical protein
MSAGGTIHPASPSKTAPLALGKENHHEGAMDPSGRADSGHRQPSPPAPGADSSVDNDDQQLSVDDASAPSRSIQRDADFRASDLSDDDSDGRGGDDSDYSLTTDSDDRRIRRAARWERGTPEGARRSKRRRSDGPAPPRAGPASNGFPLESAAPSEVGGGAEGKGRSLVEDLGAEVVASPAGTVLRRTLTPAEIEEDLRSVVAMWEMASVLDFMHLFRRQLNSQRRFTAGELERVLVVSPGDAGLLADVHIDLMRGISPKSDITVANWQVHLANKMKFHWKALSGGAPSPFKPEKYYEAATYAVLPSSERVRALHFMCCVRCDREDIQARLADAERVKSTLEVEAMQAAAGAYITRLARGTRGARAADDEEPPLLDTPDCFRREPTGVDAAGISYYYFDMAETTGFRLYREVPAGLVRGSGGGKDAGKDGMEEATDIDPESTMASQAVGDEDGGDDDGSKNAKPRSKKARREAERRRLLAYRIRDPPPPGRWELAACTIEELQAVGERLARSMKPADRGLGRLMLDELVPQLHERAEVEERKRRATERVRQKLGGRDGSGDMGDFDVGGRSRRVRRTVNYAFNDYDDMLRSAIRRSQRRDWSPADEGRRRVRTKMAAPLCLCM